MKVQPTIRREGIEHPQMRVIAAIWKDDRPTIDLELSARPQLAISSENKTPNQDAMACAIQYSLDHKLGTTPVLNLFDRMSKYGHQATKPNGYGSEGGCCDPHSELWMTFITILLRSARLYGDSLIIDLCTSYLADHLALCRAFWTPSGVRLATTRAKAKGSQLLRPTWSIDSQFRWLIDLNPNLDGESGGNKKQKKFDPGKPFKPTRLTMEILWDSRELFSSIKEKSNSSHPKLMIPVRRWDLPDGGMVSAQEYELPQNDPLRWIQTDSDGNIVSASRTLTDLPENLGEPTTIFGQ